MECALVILAAVASGVLFGWEPVDDGPAGYEYVVQLEPALVDGLQHGETVPIESNVPPEVGPIRRVRIVVGSGDLPRTFRDEAAADAPIVRGQNAAPVSHTAAFADGWPDDRYQSSAAPAWPTNMATSTAPAWPQTSSTGVTPAGGQQPAAGWTTISPNVAPPPLLTPITSPSAPSATSSPVTNNSSLAPLKKNDRYLATPLDTRYQTTPAAGAWGNTAAATSTASNTAPPLGSGLALPDPSPTSRSQPSITWPSTTTAGQTAQNNSSWETGWNSSSSQAAADADLVPVQPPSSRQAAPPATSQQASARAEEDRWSWPSDGQPAATGQTAAGATAPWPAPPVTSSPTVPLRSDWPAAATPRSTTNTATATAAEGWGDSTRMTPAPETNPQQSWPNNFNSGPPMQTAAGQSPVAPTGGVQLAPGATPQAMNAGAQPQLPAVWQPPWLPLLLVSLGLAGSLGANLFLGWSYMDARQRYRSLVRKTTDKFHRATSSEGRGAAA
jgi:hypothetical protein